MERFISEGYITDGNGGSEKATLELSFNMVVRNSVIEGLSLRISESGKKMAESKEVGISLTKEQWQALIISLQEALADAEEAAAI